jgi:hypothetical protein
LDQAPPPPLLTRLVQAFVSPGKLGDTLAEHPRWIGAMIVGAALLSLSVALIPLDVLAESQRRAVIASGGQMQQIPESARTLVRTISIVAPAVAFLVFAFIGAGVTTFIFAFVLGDEGTYKQYLAVGVHAAVIPTLTAVLLTPMRITAENPQLTINLSTFLFFLPEGYVANIFQAMDLSQIWASLVTAQGIHAIDKKRSFASAAAIQLGILFVIALIAAWFLSRAGM